MQSLGRRNVNNINNNNDAISKNDNCSKYLSRDETNVQTITKSDVHHLTHRCMNSIGYIRMRSGNTIPSSYVRTDIKTRSTAHNNIVTVKMQEKNTKLNSKKVKPIVKNSSDATTVASVTHPSERKYSDRRRTTSTVQPIDLMLTATSATATATVAISKGNKPCPLMSDGQAQAVDDIPKNLNSITAGKLRRGKRSLSSTRLKREISYDSLIKLQRKHTNVRIYSDTDRK